MVVYVTTQGARIIREGRHLLVKKGEDTWHTLFVEKLEQLVICGNVELTHPAWCMLLRHGVDTVFLTRDGRYLGRFTTPEPKNVFLRRRQYRLTEDGGFGLGFARAVVGAKLASQATMLMRIKRTRGKKEAGRRARDIRALIDNTGRARDLDAVRGYEGRGGAVYFSCLRYGLDRDFGFTRRVRRPPTDPVNAVLSLVYTFLMNRVYAAVRLAGLDPYPGYLHVCDYGRHSLVLDLMEEFRVPVADTLTLALFNLKVLQEKDFVTVRPQDEDAGGGEERERGEIDLQADPYGLASAAPAAQYDLPPQRMHDTATPPPEEDGRGKLPVRLVPEAMKRVIENFERKLATRVHYPPEDRSIPMADIIRAQAAHFRKVVEGEAEVYQPFVLR